MKMPNFIIIGAPRSGTTTLYMELRLHPQIFMSRIKEPLFFAIEGEREPFLGPKDYQGIRDLETYCSLFSEVRDEKVVGEASPIYLYSKRAPYCIKHYLPEVKIIAILRNPVDRAYSHFIQHKQSGRENINDFREAIEKEEEREQKGWSPFWYYRKIGLFGEQLTRYFSLFKSEQIKVFLFDDLLNNHKDLFKGIFQFLNVDERFEVGAQLRRNSSGYTKSSILHKFLTEPNFISKLLKTFLSDNTRLKIRLKYWDRLLKGVIHYNITRPSLDPEIRQWLIGYYREDILRTQDILKRDLSHWLSMPKSQSNQKNNDSKATPHSLKASN